jgi:hypothetical protein
MSGLCNEILAFAKAHWPDAKDFFNSVFFTAIVGAFAASLAGAFAGGRAAQRAADKTRNKEELLKEIRATNVAVMLAFGICNTLLSAKKQYVKALKETFDREKASTKAALMKQQAGVGGLVNFLGDFRTLPVLDLPVGILRTQVFEKISLQGRPILLVTTLVQAVGALNLCIAKRNELIEGFKTSSLPDAQKMATYFGFPFGGQVNQEYSDTIEAIYRQTDDCIFFSSQLCTELSDHGDRLSASFKRRFGKEAIRIHRPDFAKAVGADLMPKQEDYADWMSMFVKRAD